MESLIEIKSVKFFLHANKSEVIKMQTKHNYNNIAKAIQFIKENYIKQITLDEISRECGMSKYHFTRTFKNITGTTFREHHNKIKIEASKNLLKTQELNITEICYIVGYNDASYFSRVFSKLEGISPILYKKKATNLSNINNYSKKKQYYPFFEQKSAGI